MLCQTAKFNGGWCGQCYANLRGRSAFKGHQGYRPPASARPKEVAMSLANPKKAPPGASRSTRAVALSTVVETPHLFEIMTATQYDDGTPRLTATLTVFLDDGVLKVALNDRDMERSTYMTGDSMEAILEAIEVELAEDLVEWRAWKGRRGKK